MNPVEVVVGLILVAVVVSAIAQRLQLPYPTLLVLGGLALGFIPGLPHIEIPPDVAFLIFIPPLVYLVAAQFGLRDLRSNMWPILRLSVGLVLLNLVGVACAVHGCIDGFSWPAAFVLAAIVSPTDTVAVVAVTGRLSIPKRVERILEGESLFNDVVALVAYQQAVKVTVTGTFSLSDVGWELVWDTIGGIGVGFAVGALAAWARRRVGDPAASTACSLVTPFASYLTAEAIGASGVLATVATGLYVGRYLLSELKPDERLQAFSFWAGTRFILEGFAFVLIGLQLRLVLADVSRTSGSELLGNCLLICGTTIVIRLGWMLLWNGLPRLFDRRPSQRDPHPPWQQAILIAWAGMRGVDSLAAALAVPLVLADGATPFPQRNMILFLSFSVILATLVMQGLTLPLLIRRLKFPADDVVKQDETRIRLAAAEAASRRLDELTQATELPPATINHLRTVYQNHIQRYQRRLTPTNQNPTEQFADTTSGLMLELLKAQRRTVAALKAGGTVSEEAVRRVEQSLDYEELNVEAGRSASVRGEHK